jgi:hypothetical protein
VFAFLRGTRTNVNMGSFPCADNDNSPAWHNKLDVIMMHYSAPHVRHLRLLVQREDTLFLTLVVILILGVGLFLYFGMLAALLLVLPRFSTLGRQQRTIT